MNKIITLISAIILINSLIPDEGKVLLEGTYQIRPGFNITITNESDGLYVDPDRKPKEKLTKLNESHYRIESIDGRLDFSLILNKKRERVIVKMYGQTIHAPRLPFKFTHEDRDVIELSNKVLQNYEGIYELNESTKFSIKHENGELLARLTGQPEFQVYPYAANKFFYEVTEAALEFIYDENGAVEYLLLYQNGVILQADRK